MCLAVGSTAVAVVLSQMAMLAKRMQSPGVQHPEVLLLHRPIGFPLASTQSALVSQGSPHSWSKQKPAPVPRSEPQMQSSEAPHPPGSQPLASMQIAVPPHTFGTPPPPQLSPAVGQVAGPQETGGPHGLGIVPQLAPGGQVGGIQADVVVVLGPVVVVVRRRPGRDR